MNISVSVSPCLCVTRSIALSNQKHGDKETQRHRAIRNRKQKGRACQVPPSNVLAHFLAQNIIASELTSTALDLSSEISRTNSAAEFVLSGNCGVLCSVLR